MTLHRQAEQRQDEEMAAEKLLVAVGRKPNTERLGLENTKIEPDRGFIKVNEWQQTARARRLRHRRHRGRNAATGARGHDAGHGRGRHTSPASQ